MRRVITILMLVLLAFCFVGCDTVNGDTVNGDTAKDDILMDFNNSLAVSVIFRNVVTSGGIEIDYKKERYESEINKDSIDTNNEKLKNAVGMNENNGNIKEIVINSASGKLKFTSEGDDKKFTDTFSVYDLKIEYSYSLQDSTSNQKNGTLTISGEDKIIVDNSEYDVDEEKGKHIETHTFKGLTINGVTYKDISFTSEYIDDKFVRYTSASVEGRDVDVRLLNAN